MIGGIGLESTIDYYKRIISGFRERFSPAIYPEIIVYSANLTELMTILEAKDWKKLTEWLAEKVEVLHRAGAEFAVVGSNTPHIVFEEVKSRSPIPMLNIIEETRKKPQGLGLKKLGSLGA